MSERLPSVSGRQLVKVLERRGWYVKRIRGSHHKCQARILREALPRGLAADSERDADPAPRATVRSRALNQLPDASFAGAHLVNRLRELAQVGRIVAGGPGRAELLGELRGPLDLLFAVHGSSSHRRWGRNRGRARIA